VFKGSTNYRLHRKALIVDNKYALYGGSNIGDEYLSMLRSCNYWRDQNFLLEGEIVNSINISFINDWISFTDYSVSYQQKKGLTDNLSKYLIIHQTQNKVRMQLCTSAPNSVDKGIMNTMSTMILHAKKSVELVTPYFAPTELCSSALNIAARSGVKVRIILPGKPDNKNFIVTVNRGQYLELLNMPCEVYEYNGFIHSKYLIIDDEYVFLTTANFDYRSF
jgi:cardiolipin synthase